jgi:hypothetical protein
LQDPIERSVGLTSAPHGRKVARSGSRPLQRTKVDMQRDESEPPVSSYTGEEGPVLAKVSAPVGSNKPTGVPPTPPSPPRPSPIIVRDWNGRILAFVSLAIALIGLAYNTWRNESTEAHRNVRQACFILLEESAALQQLVHIRFYGGDRSTATWVSAWGKATLIRDLGMLAPSRTAQEAQTVFNIWSKRAQGIDERNPLAEDEMSDAIERLRRQTLQDLRELE